MSQTLLVAAVASNLIAALLAGWPVNRKRPMCRPNPELYRPQSQCR